VSPRRARPLGRVAVIVTVAAALLACTDDDPGPAATSSSTTSSTTTPTDPELVPFLVTADDLPTGFTPNADVDDTITAFCVGQDAAAGLRASGRAVAGFSRTPAGASVIELAFRFEGDGATRFVAQADTLFTGCNEVPDQSGLAFTYSPVSPPVSAALAGADSAASSYGVSIGSGNLTLNVAVVRRGDVGVLVAVLGLSQPREDLDALAATTFAAVLARLTRSSP
jgi:hypothetical protein